MKEPLYAERSIDFYVAHARKRASAPTPESALTAMAVLALLVVLATIMIGGG